MQTAIWDKADGIDIEPYADSAYRPIMERFQRVFVDQGRDGYPAERLGELIHTALTADRPKVRYAAVKGRALEKLMMRFASPRALDSLIGKRLGLQKR